MFGFAQACKVPSSWYMAIYDFTKNSEFKNQEIKNFRFDGFTEYYHPKHDYRTITVRRSKESWSGNYLYDPQWPPIVWALWCHQLRKPLIGYFEEINCQPKSEDEVKFLLSVFKMWLIDLYAPGQIIACSKKHPRFFEELPEHRRVKRKSSQSSDFLTRGKQHLLEQGAHHPHSGYDLMRGCMRDGFLPPSGFSHQPTLDPPYMGGI